MTNTISEQVIIEEHLDKAVSQKEEYESLLTWLMETYTGQKLLEMLCSLLELKLQAGS